LYSAYTEHVADLTTSGYNESLTLNVTLYVDDEETMNVHGDETHPVEVHCTPATDQFVLYCVYAGCGDINPYVDKEITFDEGLKDAVHPSNVSSPWPTEPLSGFDRIVLRIVGVTKITSEYLSDVISATIIAAFDNVDMPVSRA
jgi:hypothetical protein